MDGLAVSQAYAMQAMQSGAAVQFAGYSVGGRAYETWGAARREAIHSETFTVTRNWLVSEHQLNNWSPAAEQSQTQQNNSTFKSRVWLLVYLCPVEQISYSVPAGSNIPVTPTATFSYDNIGNRTQMTDGLGSVTYEYNQLSQLTAETRFFNDSLPNAPLAGNGFRLQYSYSLAGQLSSFTDPYGQQINYARDKIGRLSAVTGSTQFAGISTYATGAQYRAWGALKHLDYGNGVQLNMTTFNNKLQATDYEVKKNATSIIKKQYQFYNDGSLAYVQDVNTPHLDRLYKYDQLGRTVTAKSGAEARGQSAPETEIPYRQQMTYDAFDHQIVLTAVNYASGEQTTYSGYTNNRGGDWAYDAEGNVLADEQGAYQYDAAGRTIGSTPRDADDASHVLPPTYKFADGTGQALKQIKDYDANNPNGTAYRTTYYIRSTVLGGEAVTGVNKASGSHQTFVKADGTTLATLTAAANAQQFVSFPHQDASGASLRTSNENGQASYATIVTAEDTPAQAEYDAFGQNAGLTNPYVPPPTEPDEGNGPTLPGGLAGGGTMVNGRLVTYGADGQVLSREEFNRQLDSAFPGGEFSILEQNARLSKGKYLFSSYTYKDKRASGEISVVAASDRTTAFTLQRETHGEITQTNHYLVDNENWTLGLQLLPKERQNNDKFIIYLSDEEKTVKQIQSIVDVNQ